MKLGKVFVAATLLLLLAVALCISGCNTVHGAGKDIERTGELIQGE